MDRAEEYQHIPERVRYHLESLDPASPDSFVVPTTDLCNALFTIIKHSTNENVSLESLLERLTCMKEAMRSIKLIAKFQEEHQSVSLAIQFSSMAIHCRTIQGCYFWSSDLLVLTDEIASCAVSFLLKLVCRKKISLSALKTLILIICKSKFQSTKILRKFLAVADKEKGCWRSTSRRTLRNIICEPMLIYMARRNMCDPETAFLGMKLLTILKVSEKKLDECTRLRRLSSRTSLSRKQNTRFIKKKTVEGTERIVNRNVKIEECDSPPYNEFKSLSNRKLLAKIKYNIFLLRTEQDERMKRRRMSLSSSEKPNHAATTHIDGERKKLKETGNAGTLRRYLQ